MANEVAQILSQHTPSLREKLGNATYDIARYLGFPYANRMRDDLESAVDFVPIAGDAVAYDDAANQFNAGNYLGAAAGVGLATVGLIPGVGDIASKAIKRLPDSASLISPAVPTIEQLAAHASLQPVELSMARGSQPKMDWEAFNSGNYGPVLFPGYEDAPVASMRRDGEYIVYDGHHRTVKALNEEQTHLPMYVIDASAYDPANAGIAKSPSRWSTDDEALLRELLGD